MEEKLLKEIKRLSGHLKEPNGVVYGTYDLPGLKWQKASKDTSARIKFWHFLDDLKGKRILDIGSNTGAVSFELAKRGAKVFGWEFNQERVNLCNRIAAELDLDATFFCVDLEKPITDTIDDKFDIVLCWRVDEFIIDRLDLYKKIRNVTAPDGVFYFESNAETAPEKIEFDLKRYFSEVDLILFDKFTPASYFLAKHPDKKGTLSYERADFGTSDEANEIIDGYNVAKVLPVEWERVKEIYETIKHYPYIPEIVFDEVGIIKTKIVEGLEWYKIDEDKKPVYKKQLLELLRMLYSDGVCHRNLNLSNIVFNDKINVINWELLTYCRVSKFKNHYDVRLEGGREFNTPTEIGKNGPLGSQGVPKLMFDNEIREDIPDIRARR